MHIDTGHNFPETLSFRDQWAKELGINLRVRTVQNSIDAGRVVEEKGINATRNVLQITTLLDAIKEFIIVFSAECHEQTARNDVGCTLENKIMKESLHCIHSF